MAKFICLDRSKRRSSYHKTTNIVGFVKATLILQLMQVSKETESYKTSTELDYYCHVH